MRFWCNHEWEVLSKTVLPSPYEQMQTAAKARGQRVSKFKSDDIRTFQTAVTVIVKCTKCPKIKQFTTRNPEQLA